MSFFIDNHCHLTDERIGERALELLTRAWSRGVRQLVLAGTDPSDWERQKKLVKAWNQMEPIVAGELVLKTNFGVHPWWVERMSEFELDAALNTLAMQLDDADALGETGLDFSKKRNPEYFAIQERAFRAQIRLAMEHRKPLVLHIVQAHETAVRILSEEKADSGKIILHSYSGSSEQLSMYNDFDSFFSFSGTILVNEGYEKSKKAFSAVAMDRLLLETDSPDQYWVKSTKNGTPVLNEPANIAEIYEKASQIMEIPLDVLCEKVAENFKKVYYCNQL